MKFPGEDQEEHQLATRRQPWCHAPTYAVEVVATALPSALASGDGDLQAPGDERDLMLNDSLLSTLIFKTLRGKHAWSS